MSALTTNDRLAALNLKKGRKFGNSVFEITDLDNRPVFLGSLLAINAWLSYLEADPSGKQLLAAADLFLEVQNNARLAEQADRIVATAVSGTAWHRMRRLMLRAGRELMDLMGSNYRGGWLCACGHTSAAALRYLDLKGASPEATHGPSREAAITAHVEAGI